MKGMSILSGCIKSTVNVSILNLERLAAVFVGTHPNYRVVKCPPYLGESASDCSRNQFRRPAGRALGNAQ